MAGDRRSDCLHTRHGPFQFTPARGGRPPHGSPAATVPQFQFTPARGGRHGVPQSSSAPPRFQFTPARGGRLWTDYLVPIYVDVSIHARAWRATCPAKAHAEKAEFQFTPARGGRHKLLAFAFEFLLTFQFTPARGGRQIMFKVINILIQVSIHARAWRATESAQVDNDLVPVSIHARAWRATLYAEQTGHAVQFQFTPARGGRPVCVSATRIDANGFNSRPRVAGDSALRRC